MEEMKRILFSVKHAFVVFVLVLFAFLFAFQKEDSFEDKLQEEVYERDYNTFYEEMKISAERMLNVSIYGEKNSFSYRNIQKTLDDYAEIRDWKVTKTDTSLEEHFFDFGIYPYLIIAYVFFLVISFAETRKCNLEQLIHASKGGRNLLCVKRVGILVVAVCLCTFLIYGIRLFSLQIQYGRAMQYDIPVQTIDRFFYIPHCYTVGEFLVRLLIAKCLTMVILGCFIWMLQSLIKHMVLTAGAILGIYFLEFALQNWLVDSSNLAILKYVNMLCLVEPMTLYETYLNLNVFGYPVGILELNYMVIPIFACLTVVGLFYQVKTSYPVMAPGILAKWMEKAKKPFMQVLHKLRYAGLESYKILFTQKGIWAIVLLMFFANSYEGPTLSFVEMEDVHANQYYTEWEGKIDEELLQNLEKLLMEQRGLMTEDTYNMNHLKGLQKVYNHAQLLYDRAQEKGTEAVLVSPYAYQSILGKENRIYHLEQAVKMVAMIVLIAATLIPYEREKQMQYLIQTTAMGRNRFFRKKILVGLIWIVGIATVFYSMEIQAAAKVFSGFRCIMSSAQNLLFMGQTFDCSILTLIIGVYLVKIVLCILVYLLVVAVSSGIKRSRNSLMILFLVLEGPLLILYYLLAS